VARRAAFLLLGLALISSVGATLRPAAAGRSTDADATIVAPPTYVVAPWGPDTDNLVPASGTIKAGSTPVAGVRVRVDGYDVPAPTDAQGRFVYLLDHSLLARHAVVVLDASGGRVGGRPLTDYQQAELRGAQAAIEVAYALRDLHATRNGAGNPVLTGRLADSAGAGPPPVGLLTYRLTGTVTDANGKPVAGAQVSTRTLDRDYWTVSTPTDEGGRYSSLFSASSEAPIDPVPFTVRVSKGDLVYQFLPQEFVSFKRLESARLDIRLPPSGYAMALPRPEAYAGAVYTGILAGVTANGAVVKPLSLTWPDRSGRFEMVLPRRLAGRLVSLWEGKLTLFAREPAHPGGDVDLRDWPATLPADAPRDLDSIRLPR